MIAMMIPNMASGNIAIRHKAKGPTLPVVTACATSAHAVGEAFRAIKHAMPMRFSPAARGGHYPRCRCGLYVLSRIDHQPDPATACRPFDADRDGFVMGEGACVLVLEGMEHAQARGAHIYAEIVGYGNTDDAYHITSPDPEAAGIARAISLAVAEATSSLPRASTSTLTAPRPSSTIRLRRRALSVRSARTRHEPRTSRRPSR